MATAMRNFFCGHADRWPWSAGREAGRLDAFVHLAARARQARGDAGLVQRGLLAKIPRPTRRFRLELSVSLPERRRLNRAWKGAA